MDKYQLLNSKKSKKLTKLVGYCYNIKQIDEHNYVLKIRKLSQFGLVYKLKLSSEHLSEEEFNKYYTILHNSCANGKMNTNFTYYYHNKYIRKIDFKFKGYISDRTIKFIANTISKSSLKMVYNVESERYTSGDQKISENLEYFLKPKLFRFEYEDYDQDVEISVTTKKKFFTLCVEIL